METKKSERSLKVFQQFLLNFSFLTILFVLILLFTSPSTHILDGKISGVVTNGTNTIPFAKVRIKTTQIFTSSDVNGKFTLQGIISTGNLIVTAWIDGYYNGEAAAKVGDTNIVVTLSKLPATDNTNYQFLSPLPNPNSTFNCGNCHAQVILNQWQNDAHSQSAKNPFFFSMYNGTDINGTPNVGFGYKIDFKLTNGNCAACHIPGAVLANPLGVNPNEVMGTNLNGVFCDFCHKISSVKENSGQGSPGVLSIEMLRPPDGEQMFFGPYDDINKPDSYLPLIKRSEYCAPCHNGKFWGIPSYNEFEEWKESPYPGLGIQCQTCHMTPDGVTTNFAPGKGGFERDPLTIPSHLMLGSRDQFFLSNSITMNISARQIRDSLKVMVTIYNDKTGHNVPTGNPARNMILLLDVKDMNSVPLTFLKGSVIPFWGGEGSISERNYSKLPGKGYAKILADNLNGLAPAPNWRPTNIQSDNRISAFSTDTSFYYFKVPNYPTLLKVNAKLIFRRFFKQWLDEKKFNIPDLIIKNETVNLTTTQVIEENNSNILPTRFKLFQNYPNPFNSTTRVRIFLSESSFIKLVLFDVTGKEIKTIANKYIEKGEYEFNLELADLSSGIYFYKLTTNKFSDAKKLLLLK